MGNKIGEIIGAMEGGSAVVTVNVRLARYILSRYEAFMGERGDGAWPTPQVISFSAWMGEVYDSSSLERPVLSEARRGALWRRIVSGDAGEVGGPGGGLSRVAALSQRLMAEYGVPFESDIYLTDESRSLKRWSEVYKDELNRLGFVDPSALGGLVAGLIRDGDAVVADSIVFAGFDELSPPLKAVKESLDSAGTVTGFWPSQPHRPGDGPSAASLSASFSSDRGERPSIRVYKDELDEVRQAARWARAASGPGVTVGVVVPDLARYRAMIEREFAAELDPPSALPWKKAGVRAFNISLAPMLSEEPLVKAAIDILAIDERPAPTGRLGRILTAPFISAGTDEYLAVASIDSALKKEALLTVTVAGFSRRARELPSLEGFSGRLDRWLTILRAERGPLLPSRWAASFDRLLKALGWPGAFTLSSREFQAQLAWKALLDTLATLDDMLGEVTRGEAAAHLSAIASSKAHQPETLDTPVQVLGLLESSAIFFDHLWIMGAHEECFPERATPDPFIPMALQRRFKLPGVTSERCLEFARVVAARLRESTTAPMVVSAPSVVDGKEVRVSPIYVHMAGEASGGHDHIAKDSRLVASVLKSAFLEERPAAEEVAVTEEERELIGRSTTILKDQSACPFRAFAVHRLGARTVAAPEPGLSHMERGTIVHAALGFFWKKGDGSATLAELSEGGALGEAVARSVESALRETGKVGEGRFFDLEKERVSTLVRAWLEGVELKRSPFTVKAVEEKRTINAGGLELDLRVDRIDRLEGVEGESEGEPGGGPEGGSEGEAGGLINALIDYKTGGCSRNDWLGERPRDPQLPLYTLSGVFDAVAFARLSVKGVGFEGTARSQSALPGVKSFDEDRWTKKIEGVSGWDDFMERLRRTVDSLGSSFMKGEAAVDPLGFGTRESACEWCEVKPLCRIFEEGRVFEGEEGGVDDE